MPDQVLQIAGQRLLAQVFARLARSDLCVGEKGAHKGELLDLLDFGLSLFPLLRLLWLLLLW